MRYPVLIVLHQEHSTPGRIGHAVQQLGYTLDVRRPRFGDPLPAPILLLSGQAELDDEVAGEVLWLDLAALFPPEPE